MKTVHVPIEPAARWGASSEERLSQGLVFRPVHGEASGIVGRRAVRVNRKQRGAG